MNAVLTEIFRDHGALLMRFARRSLDEQDRKELLQSTLEKVWRQCAEFKGSGELLHWLRVVHHRTVLDHLRKTRPEALSLDADESLFGQIDPSYGDASQADAWNPLVRAESREAMALFASCFARFADKHPQAAAVLTWVVEDEPSNMELALTLGRTPGAAREYVSQCRKKSYVHLAPWYALVGRKSKQVA
jgi:RNA polymerase sigma factor (sigma-70 family)